MQMSGKFASWDGGKGMVDAMIAGIGLEELRRDTQSSEKEIGELWLSASSKKAKTGRANIDS